MTTAEATHWFHAECYSDKHPLCERTTVLVDTKRSVEITYAIGVEQRYKWLTIYSIRSFNENKGNAQYCLEAMKLYAESHHYVFGCTVALNDKMRHILQKLNITEYK